MSVLKPEAGRTAVWKLAVAFALVAVVWMVAATDAPAAKPRVPGPNGRDLVKPRHFTTNWIALYDETTYRGKKLRWRGWGKRVATGRGRLTHCVAEYERCHSFRGRIQFRKRVNFGGCGGVPYPYYTQIRITSGHGGMTRWSTFLRC